ncbi:MAG: transcriptional regulator, ArsR family [Nocardioidaceae bacterium]|nr:transcriptional regulator, ArsR family [Nocardioidaceae bacterium]
MPILAPPSRDSLASAAALFHGFSDPSRLSILRHLAVGEQRVVDLTEHLGLAQSTVSQHLACLQGCGLVTSRPQGRASIFSLTRPDELRDLFAAAERLLDATGEAVTLCDLDSAAPRGDR